MRTDSDGLVEENIKNDVEALVGFKEGSKLKNDPRITRFGKILRKTSLDENRPIWLGLIIILKTFRALSGRKPHTGKVREVTYVIDLTDYSLVECMNA